MSRSHSHGIAQADLDIETVDLTLSPSPSPEPQPQPRRRPMQQTKLPTHFEKKQTATPHSMSSCPQAADPGAPPPSIPTDHLRHIIDSCDAKKVSELLLDLCKSSPALSGAVARGLAPHSTWAKATIKDYQKRAGLSHIKTDPERSSRPSIESTHRMPSSTPRLKFEIKNEADTFSTGSDSPSSPDHVELLWDRPVRSSNNSRANFAGPSSTPHRTNMLLKIPNRTPTLSPAPPNFGQSKQSKQPVRVKSEPNFDRPICRNCHQRFDRGTPCRYHPMRKMIDPDTRLLGYKCCKKPLVSEGCVTGRHIAVAPGDDRYISKKPRLG